MQAVQTDEDVAWEAEASLRPCINSFLGPPNHF